MRKIYGYSLLLFCLCILCMNNLFCQTDYAAYRQELSQGHAKGASPAVLDQLVQYKKDDDAQLKLFRQKEANATVQAACTNLDFETGTTSGWTTTGNTLITTTAMGNDVYGGFPKVFPGGSYSLRLGNDCNYTTSVASQVFAVTPANALLTVNFAFVLLDFTSHDITNAASVLIEVLDPSGVQIACTVDKVYALASTSGLSSAGVSIGDTPPLSPCGSGACGCDVLYFPWTNYTVDLSAYSGSNVTLRITDMWCGPQYDFAYSYIDCSCHPLEITQANLACGSTQFQLCGPAGLAGYSWIAPAASGVNGATTACVTTSTIGTYTVQVQTTGACPQPQPIVFTATASSVNPIMAAMAAPVNVSCNAGKDGVANVTATNGSPPYTYSWSTGASTVTTAVTSQLSGIGSGIYTVTITDNSGCTSATHVTLTAPSVISPVSGMVPETCGLPNGAASVNASGGTGAYTYSWSSGGSTQTVNGLIAQAYVVTVTDANGCTATAGTTVTGAGGTIATMGLPVNISCHGEANGVVSVNAAGGTPNYTYNWSTGASSSGSSTTNQLTGLIANPYTVTITDASGCQSTTSVTLTEPPAMALVPDSIDGTCGLINGSVGVSVTGGTGAYSYNWSSGGSAQTLNGLAGGAYGVTVTDANGCTSLTTMTISTPSAVVPIPSSKNLNCFGDASGTAAVSATGGTGVYSYLWSSGSTAASVSALAAAAYSVTVTDAKGCTATGSVLITQPVKLTLTATGLSTKCFGHCDGQAVVIPSGGTGLIAALWSTGGTNLSINNLCAGNPSVTITDVNGCQHDTSVVVPEPFALAETLGSNPADCFQSNGSASVLTTSGGTGGYTYNWSNGAVSQTVLNISPGIYKVTVTDANACTRTDTVSVLNIPGVQAVILNATPIPCFGNCTSSATSQANGGTGPYVYNWNNASNAVTATSLCAGNYVVTITDAKNCTSKASVVITEPTAVTLPAITPAAVCAGQSGSLTASPGGGTPAYTISWNPGNLAGPTVSIAALTPGTYTVSATDANGCPSPLQTVTVNPLPVVNFVADTTNGCPLLCVNFLDKSTIQSGGISTWEWTFSNGSTATSQSTKVCFGTGVYNAKLHVTSSAGCASTDSIQQMISVWSDPKAAFTTDPASHVTILNPVVSFYDKSTGGVTNWLWAFGDTTQTDTIQNPIHHYANEGIYCGLLTVSTIHQCKDTVQHCIEVGPDFTFFVPNAFTPNGDGVNDFFTGKGIGIVDYKLLVFDRWGNMIFESQDINMGWDGRANGGTNMAQQDVYSYLIDITDVFNKKHSYLGHITLVR